MTPERFEQVVREGNHARIEEAWMTAVSAADAEPGQLGALAPALAELRAKNRAELAGTLVSTGIDAVAERFEPAEALKDAGPLLLAIGDSETLRTQVSELYRSAYGDRDGFEALLTESGLPKGRPVRRALRTLEVCLAVDAGSFLLTRDEPGAARIDAVDRTDWRFTVATGNGTETLGAVHLADRYYPGHADDFQVLKQFDRDGLRNKLANDPIGILKDLSKERDNRIDTYQLMELFVPELMDAAGFKKWWTKARTAIKGVPSLQLEGRSPYVVTCIDENITFEDILESSFAHTHDAIGKLAVVDQYLKDCAVAGQEPSNEALRRCYEDFADQASKAVATKRADAAFLLTAARRTGESAGVETAADALSAWLGTGPDLRRAVEAITDASLLDLFLKSVVEAKPDSWPDQLQALLPWLPQAACESVAVRLRESGRAPSELHPLVQQILASPVEHFEALLWLWDGPSSAEITKNIHAVTILTRLLRALDESRRDNVCTRERAKRMATRARSVLSARKFERFIACLGGIERGMASALRTRINQLDALGRAVREDMLGLLLDHFPTYDLKAKLAPWEREDVLYVSEEGMARKRSELDHHVNVKMKENAKAIGVAAEKGDLSENSEYKFALEERDLLRARLMQMNAEMSIAEVIQPEDVPTDAIGVGTLAVFEPVDGGARYELVFLGPWDADPEKGWLNYASPLGLTLMGKQVGDSVEFDHSGRTGMYRIVELRNGLLEAASRGA